MTAMTGLNWFWISIMATAPWIVGVLVALPFWRTRQMTFGSIVGTAVIFGTAIGLILREYVEIDRIVQDCLDAGGAVCFPEPSAFTRFAIYAFIGLLEVFALFIFSLKFEERRRRRDYAPEWQR
jgi:hypothetical protein